MYSPGSFQTPDQPAPPVPVPVPVPVPSVGPDKEVLVFDIAVTDPERMGLGTSPDAARQSGLAGGTARSRVIHTHIHTLACAWHTYTLASILIQILRFASLTSEKYRRLERCTDEVFGKK